jgi:hypothetical protein
MEREVDGEILLLDTESNLIHQLNTTASFIWRICQEGASAGEIAARVAENFDVEEDIARADLEKTIDQFRALKIVEYVPDLKAKMTGSRGEQNEE